MIRFRILAWVALLSPIPAVLAGGDERAKTLEGVVTIRRIFVPDDQIPPTVQQEGGVLQEIPRQDFEKRLQTIKQNLNDAYQTPQIARCYYQAALVGNDLKGSAVWSISNPNNEPSVLPISELKLALTNARLQSGPEMKDTRAAVIGSLDRQGPALFLLGNQSRVQFAFDWSLRSSSSPGIMHFEFQAPACVEAKLELLLPRSHRLQAAQKGIFVSSQPGSGNLVRWEILFSGKSRISLKIYHTRGDNAHPGTIFASVESKQTLLPNQADNEYTFHVKVLHNAVEELIFPWRFSNPPQSVSCRNVRIADVKLAHRMLGMDKSKKGNPEKQQVLVVRFAEPVLDKLPPLQIKVSTALPVDGKWVSPHLHLDQAIITNDRLTLHVHPDVQLQDFSSESYRFVQAAKDDNGFDIIEFENAQPSNSKYPTARIALQESRVAVTQKSWWRIGMRKNSFHSHIIFQSIRGARQRFEIKLPENWQNYWKLDSLQITPKDMVEKLAIVRRGKFHFLTGEQTRSIAYPQPLKIVLHISSSHSEPSGINDTFKLAFPELGFEQDAAYSGTMAVTIEPSLQVADYKSSVPSSTPDQDGLWSDSAVDFFHRFHNKSLSGFIELAPTPPRMNAACTSKVMLQPTFGLLKTRIQLNPIAGRPKSVQLFVSAPVDRLIEATDPKSPKVLSSIRRIPLAGFVGPPSAAGIPSYLPLLADPGLFAHGEYWILNLAEPLDRPRNVDLQAKFLPNESGQVGVQHWNVPAVLVANATEQSGVLQIESSKLKIAEMQSSGFHQSGEAELPAQKKSSGSRLTFRSGSLLGLWLQSTPVAEQAVSSGDCENATLTTVLRSPLQIENQLSFTLSNWSSSFVTVDLPNEAAVLSVSCDGRALSPPASAQVNERRRFILPTQISDRRQHFEIRYSVPVQRPHWYLWGGLQTSFPLLSVTPASKSRRYVLPPGIVPMNQNRMVALDGAAFASQWRGKGGGRKAWRLGGLLFDGASNPFLAGTNGNQRLDEELQLIDAELRKNQSGNPLPFQQLLEETAYGELSVDAPVILDSVALQAIGISSGSTVTLDRRSKNAKAEPVDIWRRFGLEPIVVGKTVLITSRRQWSKWRSEKSAALADDEWLNERLSEAVRHGHDSSGRFITAAGWIHRGRQSEPTILDGVNDAGWTVWTPATDADLRDEIVLINQVNFWLLGSVLAAVCGLIFWKMSVVQNVERRFRLFVVWLAAGLLVLTYGPFMIRQIAFWPVIVTGLVLFLCLLFGRPKERHSSGDTSPSAIFNSLAVVGVIFLGAISTSGQEPAPNNVYIVGAPNSPVEDQKVLVAPALLEKLRTLEENGRPAFEEAVITGGEYDGKLQGKFLIVTAVYQVYCFDGQTDVVVPLDGVSLLPGATLNGKETFPIPATAGKAGYLIRIAGYKDQTVELKIRFKVAVQDKGHWQEIRCVIPRLLQNHLKLELPKGCRSIRAPDAVGRQEMQHHSNHELFSVDLGELALQPKETDLVLRWVKPAGKTEKAASSVNEYHLWDLQLSAQSLVSVFEYKIANGSVSRFHIRLPEELHLQSIEIRESLNKDKSRVAPRIQQWKTIEQADKRLLEVVLDGPVSGEVTLTLNFNPVLSLDRSSVLLLLPSPLEAELASGLIAYYLDKSIVDDPSYKLSVTKTDPEHFSTEWQKLQRPNPGVLTRSYSFRRSDGNALAGFRLLFAKRRAMLEQDLNWELHSQFAQVNALLHLKNAEGSQFLQWKVPANLTISELTGETLLRWNTKQTKTNRVLQLWLRNPGESTAVSLSGWINRNPNQVQFKIPRFSVIGEPTQSDRITVAAIEQLKIRPLDTRNATVAEKVGKLFYQTSAPNYAASLVVQQRKIAPAVHVLTTAERINDQIRVTGLLHFAVPPEQLEVWEEFFTNATDESIRRKAETLIQIDGKPFQSSPHSWTVDLVPAGAVHCTLKISRLLTLDGNRPVELPRIQPIEANVQSRWYVLSGGGIKAARKFKVNRMDDPSDDLSNLPDWFRQQLQPGKTWKASEPNATLSVFAVKAGPVDQVSVLWRELSAELLGNNRWGYSDTLLLIPKGNTILQLDMPPQTHVMSVVLNGKSLPVEDPEKQRLEIPLAAGQGIYRLDIRRRQAGPPEDALRLELRPAKLIGLDNIPTLYSILVPPGYRPSPGKSPSLRTSCSPAAVHLLRAEAELKVAAQLAKRKDLGANALTKMQLTWAEKNFYWNCRRAEQLMKLGYASPDETAPNGKVLKQWLEELRRENKSLAGTFLFEPVRLEAEKQPSPVFLTGDRDRLTESSGTPHYWYPVNNVGTIDIQLKRDRSENQFAGVSSLSILAALIILFIASFLPGLVRLSAMLWPELLLLFSVLGILTFGLGILPVFLVLFSVAVRLIQLVQRFWNWTHRRRFAGLQSSSTT